MDLFKNIFVLFQHLDITLDYWGFCKYFMGQMDTCSRDITKQPINVREQFQVFRLYVQRYFLQN